MRNNNFDFLKGILIILMIIGHLLPGMLTENIGRFLIYSFHMPLFIAISGYFFCDLNTTDISFVELFKKYRIRIILPFVIALLCYWMYLNRAILFSADSFDNLWRNMVKPYYHLWFIPGFLSWIVFSRFAHSLKVSISTLFFIALPLSVLCFVLREHPELYRNNPILYKPIDVLIYTFRPHFYVFFVLGMYLKNNTLGKIQNITPYVSVIGLVAVIMSYFYHQKDVFIFVFYFFNLALISFIIIKATNKGFPSLVIFEWIGVNSMGIYLWHNFPLLFAKTIFGMTYDVTLYLMLILFSSIGIGLIYLLTKINFVNTYFFGIINRK